MEEKGILRIVRSKKGRFNGSIEYTKKSGKQGRYPITANIFSRDDLDGKECTFTREGGTLTKLIVEGKTIYSKSSFSSNIANPNTGQQVSKMKRTSYEELFNAENIRLSKDTRKFVENAKIDNYSLKFNKAAQYQKGYKKDKFVFFESDRRSKGKFLNPNFSGIDFNNFRNKYDSLSYEKEQLILKPSWKLTIGLGHESVYETSITLHHIYGIPYIPASSIKGVVRSHIINEVFYQEDSEEPAEFRALQDEVFCKIFGTSKETSTENKKKEKFIVKSPIIVEGKPSDHIGSILFFDAFPIEEPRIVPEIMNVHYPDYYDEKNPPTDYQNPRPIFFPVVENTAFQFTIATKHRLLADYTLQNKTITQWLTEALQNHGIGAKTAVGYGYMEET